ncbi:RNA helicase [Rhynchospora pubera]|uniref:ATP-dependent RNA helicase n=1 Tax=Rhynchospora pubera TaxID=906938 RepID=A0AAV8H4P1_9POAL|nr:RNA helicase [Rhynchospora pubera]
MKRPLAHCRSKAGAAAKAEAEAEAEAEEENRAKKRSRYYCGDPKTMKEKKKKPRDADAARTISEETEEQSMLLGKREKSKGTVELFSDLPLSPQTLKALHENHMGSLSMTQIQSSAIPPLLEGKDVMAVARNRTGNTLAFLIPAVEMLCEQCFSPKNGTGVIILCPTGELAIKVHTDAKALLKYHTLTSGLIMNGNGWRREAESLVKGANLLVSTPSRLLFHLKNTKGFLYKNLKCVIIHEADQIGIDLRKEIKYIFKLLPKKRQNALFCGTPSEEMDELALFLFKKKKDNEHHILVTLSAEKPKVNFEMVRQCYCVIPSKRRLISLCAFLKRNLSKKSLVVFSSSNSVQFHYEILRYLQIDCLHIHSKMTQQKQTSTFINFCKADKGILLCANDIIDCASHLPSVDWFLLYEPPESPKDYIHTLGQVVASQEDRKAHPILFLMQEESKFLQLLGDMGITLEEYQCDGMKLLDLSSRLEKTVGENYYLNRLAKDAYRSYVSAYSSKSSKDVFNTKNLNFQSVAASFCIPCPPKVDLS